MENLKSIMAAIFLTVSSSVLAIPTGDKLIDEIGIQGASPDEIVLTNLSGWGASGCETASVVVLGPSVSNRQAMLSLALAAKMGNKPVRFYGDCDVNSGGNRFNATYMMIK